ncbi:circularly permuted type 2 ATP-grasp protein [Mariniblastus fucicola]|uniref:circularly permuted type 2 ATP-grasp protein n=1 Tax=Mariniblastus fucicola TaxID=980251 RepID=UPI0009462C5D|nr:circularly permuted type 2 ATP-grasp protein [Mariniblastus fucicola]
MRSQTQSQSQSQSQPKTSASDPFAQYKVGSSYDEFFDQDKPRDHVSDYHDALSSFGVARLNRRWQRARRMVDENSVGLAGHLARKVSGMVSVRQRRKIRAWQLDAIPVVIDSATWKELSAAIAQRATMYELLLQDLYGPQRLIREKVIPATLLHAHPQFLRGLHSDSDIKQFLQLVAFDLARSPDGRWWFLNDRAESPSGIGFAHENRIVLSHAFPEIFQKCNVAQLSPFYDQLQNSLLNLADGKPKARGVLLGEGMTGRNFFEEAYLARTLGYTLVRGDDLTVRNDGVHFKTLAGLKPVDLILRRKNSLDCDPLEFDGATAIGTPGLVNAYRQNQVAITNRIGSGLVESRALMAYGGKICQALMSEELKIPNVATWWCGDPKSLQFVLENLDHLTLESAFRERSRSFEAGTEMSELSLEQRKSKLLANPMNYVAQERVDRSSVPVWSGESMESARLALRTFAVSTDDGFKVMKGGLGRTSKLQDPLYITINEGEGGKDVWVESGDDANAARALSVSQKLAPRRSGFELSSRSADNLFWMGRQIERIYFSSCVLRSTIHRLIGERRAKSRVEVHVLVRCLAMQGQIEPAFAIQELKTSLPELAELLPAVILDASNSGSIATSVNELLRLGQMERNCMSLDTWRTILRIHERIDIDQPDLPSLLALADELVVDVSALSGQAAEGMTRNQVYRFVQIGRRLEHATQLIFMLRSLFLPKVEPVDPVLQTALEVADSIMTYRSRYFANYQLGGVLDLLVTDETNPRSLVWQMAQLDEHVQQLPDNIDQAGLAPERRLSSFLLHSVRSSDIQLVAESWLLNETQPMEELLKAWEESLPELHAAVSNRFFVHADTSRQIGDIGRRSKANKRRSQ